MLWLPFTIVRHAYTIFIFIAGPIFVQIYCGSNNTKNGLFIYVFKK